MPVEGTQTSTDTDRARARVAWHSLRDRIATITPAGVARAGLVAVVLAAVSWLAVASWPAAAPFLAGGLIAYAVLPLVNRLDRIMPRFLAALLAVLFGVLVVVAVLVIVIPPLVLAVSRLAADLPTSDDIDQAVDGLEQWLGTLPEGSRAIVAPTLVEFAQQARAALSGSSTAVSETAFALVRAIPDAIGVVLGLVVLPTWVLAVVTNQQAGRRAIDRRLAPWLRDDFWAFVRIADRATASYVRGFVLVGILTGTFVGLGLEAAIRLGGPFERPLALAVFAGALQLIPIVGSLLGLLVPGLLLVLVAPDRALTYAAVYIVSVWLARTLTGRRNRSALGVHPAILVPAVAAFSQLGLGWLLLSGPIVAISTDTVRYLHGRFSEPPRPAGLLPGDPVPHGGVVTPRVPSVYADQVGASAAPAPLPMPVPEPTA
jgi:predicted PurR-regulated permease PerM